MNYAVKMEYIPRNPLTVVGNFRNPYENKSEMDFYTPPKSKQNYPNNQQEVYMNGISMYFLISHSIRVCVRAK